MSKEEIETILLNEIAPYNETDWACNGGYYKCTTCNKQNYISSAQDGELVDCDCGRIKHIFKQ